MGRGAETDEGADGEEEEPPRQAVLNPRGLGASGGGGLEKGRGAKGLGGRGGGHALFSRLLLPENAFGELPDSTGVGCVEPWKSLNRALIEP